jgi:hypothetical protein
MGPKYLSELWQEHSRGHARRQRKEGGRRRTEDFCTLDYFAEYRKIELLERAKRLAALAARQRDL